MTAERTRLAVGCMTGTSLDGLDAALVRIDGTGLSMRAQFVRGVSRPLGGVGPVLRRLAGQESLTAGEIAAAMHDFAHLHVGAIRSLVAASPAKPPPTHTHSPAPPVPSSLDPSPLSLICVHGQTVYHKPPISWQLMQPAPIAREFGVPVVFDLRAADLAAGGQGAPITPIADWVLFGRRGERVAVVNLGGFCNITLLPRSKQPVGGDAERAAIAQIGGGDVCACNRLLDAIARTLLQQPHDAGGKAALSGTVHAGALGDLESELNRLSCDGRSLGTGDESIDWIERWRARASAADLAATACAAIAGRIGAACDGVERVLLAGGGVRNAALVGAIRGRTPHRVEPTDSAGVPAEYREAACFAVLGALCEDRLPITLPAITGIATPAPIAGAWVRP